MGLTGSAQVVLRRALAAPARLGGARLICIDGGTGAGKTTLAEQVAQLAGGAQVVHTDELLEGWEGLPCLPTTLAAMLATLSHVENTQVARWDWHADTWGEPLSVSRGRLLILEGVGAGSRAIRDYASCVAWVQCEETVRFERAVRRDGEEIRAPLTRWLADERALHAAEGTLAAADVVIARP